MKFACTQGNLTYGLSATSHVASRHANLPILGNVLVRIDEKIIRFIATNLEIAVTAAVRGKVEEAGEYTVPAKLFADFVGSTKGDRVDLELKGEALEVRGGASKTKIKGQPASEFPLVPDVKRESATVYRVLATDFKKALSRVLFAASPNESRPEISGVLFRFGGAGPQGTLTLAATDSYRLAEAIIALHESGSGERTVIVPARALTEVGRILGLTVKDAEELPATIEIVVADNQILFSYGPVELVSRLIEGQYPDYKAVIPETAKTTATIGRDALSAAIKTAALFSHTGLHDVQLLLKKGGLTVSSADTQIGESETELDADVVGDENKVTLNHRYLMEGLSATDVPEVSLRVIDGVNPCLLVPKEQTPGSNYLYVIMPIKQ